MKLRQVYLLGAEANLKNSAGTIVSSAAVSNGRGEFVVEKVPSGTYTLECKLPGSVKDDCTGAVNVITIRNESVSNLRVLHNPLNFGNQNVRLYGHVALADGSRCGITNRFVPQFHSATIELRNSQGVLLNATNPNDYGDYFITGSAPSADVFSLTVRCGNLPLQERLISVSSGILEREVSFVLPNSKPVVTSMSAVRDGVTVASAPQVSPLPSDIAPFADWFLSYKGIDSRIEACEYYRALGAVELCDAEGKPNRGISFDDWKQTNAMGPFAGSNVQLSATFVNKVDLNLVRRMEGTRVSANRIAYVVCNHPGPLTESQADIDAAIASALSGKNLVACVAMEYSISAGVNGDRPFTKFYVFGPDGQLLPSVNLDGRGEKFVPGTCVACHGGDQYAGRYRTANNNPHLGAHFLPFDNANYHFSTQPGLRLADQEASIKQLNLLLLETDRTDAANALVNGWYASGTNSQNANHLPVGWRARSAQDQNFYLKVAAPSCRTCHVAMSSRYDFDSVLPFFNSYFNFDPPLSVNPGGPLDALGVTFGTLLCGAGGGVGAEYVGRNHAMPNSLVTFNRMWATRGQADDQIALITSSLVPLTPCDLRPDAVYRKQ